MKGSKFKIFLSIAIGIIVLCVLLLQVNLSDIIRKIISIPYKYLLLSLFIYLLFNMFRIFRFHFLLNRKINLKELTPIVLVHGLFLNILPSRMGEFSYIYMLKRKGISVSESIPVLLIARIFDGLAILFLFTISVFFLGDEIPATISSAFNFVFLLIILAILLIFILIYIGINAKASKKALKRIILGAGFGKHRIATWTIDKLSKVFDGFKMIRLEKKIILLLLYSFFIWICGYMVYVILLRGMGIQLSFWAIFVGASFVVLSSLVPIQGIAGFGTTEGIWTIVFLILGLGKESAITSGFSFHIIRLLFAFFLGLISLLIMIFSEQKIKNNKEDE